MTTRELVNLYTNHGTKNFAFIRFDGWTHSPYTVMDILKEMGYKFNIDCCTFRHHAIISAEKK